MHFQPVIQHLSRNCLRKICRRYKLLSHLRLATVAKETLRRHLGVVSWRLMGGELRGESIHSWIFENVNMFRCKREERYKQCLIKSWNIIWKMVSLPVSIPVCIVYCLFFALCWLSRVDSQVCLRGSVWNQGLSKMTTAGPYEWMMV